MANRMNATGRSGKTSFAGIPRAVMQQDKYRSLSAHARMLLFELAYDYRGHNNGDLQAAWSLMKKRGFRSPGTLWSAKEELLKAGFIIETRHGGLNSCSLYALTWSPIDECRHPSTGALKFDAGIKPGPAPMSWKDAAHAAG